MFKFFNMAVALLALPVFFVGCAASLPLACGAGAVLAACIVAEHLTGRVPFVTAD